MTTILSHDLTTSNHATENDRLLTQLDDAKRVYTGPTEHWKDMLKDPAISSLVNGLLMKNRPWLLACVKREQRQMHLRESMDELISTAIAGKSDHQHEVAGMMAAILKYDYGEYGTGNFTPFIAKAIHDALCPTMKERLTRDRSVPMDDLDGGEVRTWVDRGQRRPVSIAISNELLGVLDRAIERLPGDRKDTARFIVQHVIDHGERPAFEQVAEAHNPPVTRQRGAQLVHDTFARLRKEIEHLCPDLAKGGIGGWQEFNEVFGKGHREKGFSHE